MAMRLLFLPYKPRSAGDPVDPWAPKVSLQKHAAREHHRKAKLNRGRTNLGHRDATQRPTEQRTGQFREWDPRKEDIAVVRNTSSRPNSILGAGRLDPFDIYCAKKQPLMVHEMLDHAISCQWTLFAPDNSPQSLNVVKQAVMSLAIDSPLLFHTLIFAGATHKAFHQSSTVDNRKSQILRLTCKGKALQALRDALSSPETMCSDDVVFAMVLLASHGRGEKVTGTSHREQRLLASAQDAQFYASMEYEWSHMRGLLDVLKAKGGLQEIKVPGLAFAIASFDTHTAIMFQSKPNFPILMPSAPVIQSWHSSQPMSLASSRYASLTSGFDFLATLNLPQAGCLLHVLQGMRGVIVGFDSHQSGDALAPSIKGIIFARNLNQHELISLDDLWHEVCPPSFKETDVRPCGSDQQRGMALYELCRISALIFQIVVLLPNLHSAEAVTKAYAERLVEILDFCASRVELADDSTHQGLFFWATILGAWLAEGTNLRTWFIDHLVHRVSPLATTGNLSKLYEQTGHSWDVVREIMKTFLWLDSE